MSTAASLILGVDGGGTSTVAWLAETPDRVIGRGTAGPSNAKAVGEVRARDALRVAIAGAFTQAGLPIGAVATACLGLAGFDRPDDRAKLTSWGREDRWAQELVVVNDGELVIAAGTPENWGVGVIAGTGSIAVGRSREGDKARAGGWGHLIGDEGSAYACVLAALRLVVRRADGRESSHPWNDVLASAFCRAFDVPDVPRIVGVLYGSMDRTRIAGLAPLVLEAAELDEQIAQSVLPLCGRDLAELVVAVSDRLGFKNEPIPLALAGGFLLSADLVRAALLTHLSAKGLTLDVTEVPEPVRGALILAERARRG